MPEFYYPKTITQYAEYPDTNISWSNNQSNPEIITDPEYNFANASSGAGRKNVLTTVKPLSHIPNSGRGPVLDKTYYLKCTDFGMVDLPSNITGITVLIDAQRNGKIVDETICLVHNGEVISENKTNLSALREGHLTNNNVQTYGGETDLWGTTITPEMLMDNSFGLLLRFSSNPLYPHREGLQIYKILIKLHPYNIFVFDPDSSVEFITEDPVSEYFVSE